ncbi:MAG: alpha/beta fold hydrolase [Gemmatimonadetes bacterium]|nr:alpha/beta fold hydrolase [Gemmatimonadota bacterium]
MLHGLRANAATWQLQVAAFAPRYRVITLDLRGTPASRDRLHPRTVQHPAVCRRCPRPPRPLGARPAHVVGLSLGGMIAFQMAVDDPSYFTSMTIVNSGPAVVPHLRGTLGHRRAPSDHQARRTATFAKILAPSSSPSQSTRHCARASRPRWAPMIPRRTSRRSTPSSAGRCSIASVGSLSPRSSSRQTTTTRRWHRRRSTCG